MRLPNLNKLFPFLSIRRKLTIAFVAFSLLSLAVFGLYGYFWSVRALREEAVERTGQELATIRATTSNHFQSVAADLAFLGTGVIAHMSGRTQLDEILVDFIEARPEFFQILLLDERGAERNRVERTSRGVRAVPAEQLRVTGGRFYLEMLRGQAPLEVFITPSELQMPDGTGQVPAMTVALRLPERSAPDEGGRGRIIVGHLYARHFFDMLKAQVSAPEGVVAVTNREGHYIYRSGREKEWNRLLAERSTDNLFSDLDPETAMQVLAGGTGSIVSADDLLVSFGPLVTGGDADQYVVLRWISARAVFSRIHSLRQIILALGALSALAAVILGTVSADQFTRPIRKLQRFARSVAVGGKPADPRIETNDELELLGNDLAWMASALEARDEQIRTYAAMLERRVQRNEEHLTSVLQSSADAIISLDNRDRIQSWNQGAENIFGFTAAEAIGRSIELIVPPDRVDAGELERIGKEVLQYGFARNIETERLHKSGRTILVNLTRTLLRDENGDVIGSSSVLKDITEQKAMERRLVESEKLAAMGRLAGGIAHQIGTPLSVISGSAELVRDALDPESPAHTDVAAIMKQTRQISELVDALMSFVRRRPARLEPVDLNDVVTDALEPLRSGLERNEIRLELELEPGLPSVPADRRLVREILRNLMSNAQQAMPNGGVLSIRSRMQPLRRATGETEPGVGVEVADAGPGIRPGHVERIFEPFFTTRDVGEGTGLGLALSRQLAEHMDGTLFYSGGADGGAAFTLVLPAGEKSEA